jgi:multiple antibiotic resistance protein
MITNILLALIPIFVAVDAFGVLPLYITFTSGLSRREQRHLIVQSMLTALCLAVGFIFLGRAIFNLLGVTVEDFMIAGGAILFLLAVTDMLGPTKQRRMPDRDLGVVPLGTPLIAGPAVLTSSLIIISQYGLVPTLVSVVVNILFAGAVFSVADVLMRILGRAGAKALSKITSLLLAAIGVMMVRKGVIAIILASVPS